MPAPLGMVLSQAQNVFMVQYLVKHMDNFTFTFIIFTGWSKSGDVVLFFVLEYISYADWIFFFTMNFPIGKIYYSEEGWKVVFFAQSAWS